MLFNKKSQTDLTCDFSSPHQAAAKPAAGDATRKPLNGQPRTVIDACLEITGNLQSKGDIQIDGRLQGDIACAHLTVGKDAAVIGNIIAKEVVVRGKVEGSIRADRVILQRTAHAKSEIVYKMLIIEEGACFDGKSLRDQEKAPAPPVRAPEKSNVDKLEAALVAKKGAAEHEHRAAV